MRNRARRRARKGETANAADASRGTGLILYTSLVTICLTFFISLVSFSMFDEERKHVALGSYTGRISVLPGGRSPIETGDHALLPPQEEALEDPLRLVPLREITDQPDDLTVLGSGLRKIITIREAALFIPGDYRLKPEALPLLQKLARILNLNNVPLRIEGHTDDARELPPGVSSDWELSARRATAVLSYLTDSCKVRPERLSAFGYGGYRPLAPNSSALNRAKNRRVNFVLDGREVTLERHLEERVSFPFFYDFKGFLFRLFRRP
jgi:chemotaxis protein MotB